MKQNYIRHILMCLCLLAGSNAFAYDAEIDGIYYNFSGDEAIVTYKEYVDWTYKSDYSGAFIIPELVTYNGKTYSVTSIGDHAFSGCTGLTSITIPSCVTSIGEFAFYGCAGLSFVSIPSGMTSIGDYAFSGCSDLTSVTIPNSVTNIGNCAFWGCRSLTSVTIPNGVTSIGGNAFSECSSLTSITIPSSVTSIGYYAFSGCYLTKESFINMSSLSSSDNWGAILFDKETSDGLLINDIAVVGCRPWATSVIIPNNVTSIGGDAFRDCTSLISVTIPNSVTSIGNGAFSGCTGLTFVNINDLAAWCKINFQKAYSNPLSYARHLYLNGKELIELVIPNGVISIGEYAFSDCTSLTSVTIPNSVTSIGGDAFRDCTGLTSVTIPSSVTSIRDNAFLGCTGLTSITIPNSVTSIGGGAFLGCKLRNVLIKCTTIPLSGVSAFSEQTFYHTTLYVPTGCWDAYAYDDYWYKFINIRETAMTEEQVSEQQAYTLMDANTFTYSVYDPVNDCIGTIKSVSSIDENNPNHSWQMMEAGGARYLYNIGAKKYVKKSGTGFELISTPEPIEVEDSDNGLILGEQADRQWALVSNERMSASQSAIDEVTAIKSLFSSSSNSEDVFDLSGRKLDKPQTGVNLIRKSDGTTKKVMMK